MNQGTCEGEQYTVLLIKNLETPRLTIRSWQKSDKDFTLSLWGDKENGNYDIGYCISKSHWREGLGTEVIDAVIRWVKGEGGEAQQQPASSTFSCFVCV